MSSHGKSGKGNDDEDDAAPLPPGWTKAYSRSQKRYFWSHAETKTSQWHPPTDEEARDPKKAKEAAELRARQEREEARAKKHKSGGGGGGGGRDKKRSSSGGGSSASGSSSKKHKTSSSVSTRKGGGASSSSSTQREQRKTRGLSIDDALESRTHVAIIVPYRDIHPAQNRAKHLERFVPHMTKFLGRQVAAGTLRDFHVYVIEQSDDGRKFNRGKLLNIGFDLARKKRTPCQHDVFIFHDVDLLPGDDLGGWYARFPTTPLHIARVWDRYSNNPKYFGGIVSFSATDMRRINGYPNTFWGWGGEDDEMQKRCEKLRIDWEAPPKGTIQDLENMNIGEKIQFLRENKSWKCMCKWEALEEHDKTWRSNGLADLSYTVLSKAPLDGDGGKVTKITVDVKLNADHWSNAKAGVDYMPPPSY